MRVALLTLVVACSGSDAAPRKTPGVPDQAACRAAIEAFYDAGYWFVFDDTDGKGIKPLKTPDAAVFHVCNDAPLAYLKPCTGRSAECDRHKRSAAK